MKHFEDSMTISFWNLQFVCHFLTDIAILFSIKFHEILISKGSLIYQKQQLHPDPRTPSPDPSLPSSKL